MKKISMVFGVLWCLSACMMHHAAPPVRPELLISSSAEKISFPISDADSLASLESWLANGDAPISAEISCGDSKKICNSVKNQLTARNINFKDVPGDAGVNSGNVSLAYERVVKRECSLNNFGCATSLNSVRMVSSHEQFIKPGNIGLQDASSAVRAVGRYVK
jgi:hypothetical protein